MSDEEKVEALEVELELGGRLAVQLARPLVSMGAAECEMPVTIDGRRFKVTVEPAAAFEESEHR